MYFFQINILLLKCFASKAIAKRYIVRFRDKKSLREKIHREMISKELAKESCNCGNFQY